MNAEDHMEKDHSTLSVASKFLLQSIFLRRFTSDAGKVCF